MARLQDLNIVLDGGAQGVGVGYFIYNGSFAGRDLVVQDQGVACVVGRETWQIKYATQVGQIMLFEGPMEVEVDPSSAFDGGFTLPSPGCIVRHDDKASLFVRAAPGPGVEVKMVTVQEGLTTLPAGRRIAFSRWALISVEEGARTIVEEFAAPV